MRTIRVHELSRAAARALPRKRTLLPSAAADAADSLPVGTVVSIARIDGVTRFKGASVTRGTVRVASRLHSPIQKSDKNRSAIARAEVGACPEMDACWVSPSREVATRVLRAGIAPRETSRGLGHALRCVAGYYGCSSEPEIQEAYPAAGWGASESPAVFLLVADARDADQLLVAAPRMLRDAVELLEGCACGRGCGSCTGRHPDATGRGFVTPDRHAAATLGQVLLDPRAPGRPECPLP